MRGRELSIRDLAEHVKLLCAAHGIRSRRTPDIYNAYAVRRRIVVAPIRTRVSYFVALHEIGHLVEPKAGWSATDIRAEAWAWQWALRHALVRPTVRVWRAISWRLRSYVANRENEEMPPWRHVFWRIYRIAHARSTRVAFIRASRLAREGRRAG